MFFIFGSEGLNYKTYGPGYRSIRFSWSFILHPWFNSYRSCNCWRLASTWLSPPATTHI